MSKFKLNEQIAFLRKQKGITQEELAQSFGVTNQTVSKWESAACCPDIQLLPDIAGYFGVTIDELMGYKPADTFADIYLQIKALFEASPKEEAFSLAIKLATLLHEGACTRGYKGYVPWDTSKDYTQTDAYYRWGVSICSEPEGATIHKANSVFISDNKHREPVNSTQIRDVYAMLQDLCDKNTLKVLFTLYELTVDDFNLYIPVTSISEKCKLSEEETLNAFDHIPLELRDTEDGQTLYRIKGSYMHIPSILLLLTDK